MKKFESKGAGATPRRQYDEAYKRHAVELTLRGDRTVKAVAQELGLSYNCVASSSLANTAARSTA